jgi:hypothetical protein
MSTASIVRLANAAGKWKKVTGAVVLEQGLAFHESTRLS